MILGDFEGNRRGFSGGLRVGKRNKKGENIKSDGRLGCFFNFAFIDF